MKHQENGMSCWEMVEFLSDYVDGDLDTAMKETIRDHGGRCPPCRNFIRTLEFTVKAVQELPRESLSDSARRALLQALKKVSL
jgi:predicted anti-sigma-YlaC factor YlaD